MTTATLASTARSAQLAVRAKLMRDVVKLWPLLDAKRLEATFPAWLQAMSLTVTGYHGQSSLIASTAYRVARQEATQSPAPSRLIVMAPPPAEDWLRKAFAFSGPGLLSRDTVRPGTALSTTLGTAARIALDGGRTTVLDTVKKDPVAIGWFRVTGGSACDFCQMLADRGAVYKGEGTASFESHNHCGCSAEPAFSRDAAN